MSSSIKHLLEPKLRDELNIIARKLHIPRYRSLDKKGLITAILQCEESRVKKSLSITWWDRYHVHVYGGIGIAAFIFSILFFVVPYFDLSTKPKHETVDSVAVDEIIEITGVRPIIDQPTTIIKSFNVHQGQVVETGVLSAFWEVLLSNNGDSDLSIIDYDIYQVANEFDAIDYTHMKQGMFSLSENELISVKLPIVINAGHTEALFLKVGITMGKDAFDLVKEKYPVDQPSMLKDIADFLRQEGMDFYGNPFTSVTPGHYSLPPIDELKEQIFRISFKSSRGTKGDELISWYRYGLYRLSIE